MPTSGRGNVVLALSSPKRLRLLAALAKGPATISELTERSGLSAKNVGYHLIELRAARLVVSEKQGGQVIHSIAKPHTVTENASLDLGICSVRLGRVK